MALKNMLEIAGGLYDMWEVRTIERYQDYNETLGEMVYSIALNREGASTNANAIYISFPSEEVRDQELVLIKERLREMDTVLVIDGSPIPDKK